MASLNELNDKQKDVITNLAYTNRDAKLLTNPETINQIESGTYTVEDFLKDHNKNSKSDKYDGILDYKVVGVVNDDKKGGFGAIALMDKDGNISISFRGTDTDLGTHSLLEDMGDNLYTALIGESKQSKSAQAFYEKIISKYPDSGLYLYGHSKGGELAARILVNNQDNPNIISATFFNPQPLNKHQLTGDISVLKSDRAIAYRNEHDLVSHLGDGEDAYRVKYVKSNYEPTQDQGFWGGVFSSIGKEHSTNSNSYDEDGNLIFIDYDINENEIYNGYKNISFITQKLQNIINEFQQASTFKKIIIGGAAIRITLPIIVIALSNPLATAAVVIISVLGLIGIVASGHIEKEIKEVISSIKNYFNDLYRKVTKKGAKAVETTQIILDLNKLEDLKEKLQVVKKKIAQADSDLNLLKSVEHLMEIKPLLEANTILPDRTKIQKCINYLDGTKEAFQLAENNIQSFV